MKAIDFDGMFDEKLAEYMKKNKKKYTEKQWEDMIPKLYKKFGDTVVKTVQCTPRDYYAKMSDETLSETLKTHLTENVPVSEFLCREIEKRDLTEELKPLLTCGNEEAALYAANLLGGNVNAYDEYFAIVCDENSNEEVRDVVIENLKEHADEAKDRAIAFYEKGKAQDFMLEILSRVQTRDDKVFALLCDEFEKKPERSEFFASFLASYGDDRALPLLLKRIERQDIGFVEFQELKYAIEALGGEYDEIRDFSDDKDFVLIGEASEKEGFANPEKR